MEILVIVNPTSSSKVLTTIPVDGAINSSNGQKYKNLMNLSLVAYVGSDNGVTSLFFNNENIDGNSVIIMVHEFNISDFDTTMGTSYCKSQTNAYSSSSFLRGGQVASALLE
jgi:hypothetical protein